MDISRLKHASEQILNQLEDKETITVFIKDNSSLHRFRVSRFTSIKKLEEELFSRTGIPTSKVVLTFGGIVLKNEEYALASYKIKNNDKIYATLLDPEYESLLRIASQTLLNIAEKEPFIKKTIVEAVKEKNARYSNTKI